MVMVFLLPGCRENLYTLASCSVYLGFYCFGELENTIFVGFWHRHWGGLWCWRRCFLVLACCSSLVYKGVNISG